jgi:hypothetical protein
MKSTDGERTMTQSNKLAPINSSWLAVCLCIGGEHWHGVLICMGWRWDRWLGLSSPHNGHRIEARLDLNVVDARKQ